MIRKRFFKKALAVFLLITTLSNVVAPTVSYALTSGPTAPEATSFEPVDTTDMVNLLTGDMTYNVPLLEVPGPSGGYPLSLSYHAGIQPGEDASWVGLGWTLNPGSIHRNVNGFPDDHNGVNTSDRVYWAGGVTDTYSVGVSVGINGLASVDAGLSYSVDTYKGVGVGGYLGANVGFKGAPVNASASIGINPFGGAYASAGLGLSVPLGNSANSAIRLGAHTGFTTNFQSISYNSGVGVHQGNISLLGASITSSSNGDTFSALAGGISGSINNSKIGKISTSSSGFNVSIPLGVASISFGAQHERYWMDETENVDVFGALYTPRGQVISGFDNNAYDSYTLQDPYVNSADEPDPNFTMGASFFNYDQYFVNAQGLGGNIRPYSYKELLFRQNRKKNDGSYDINQYDYQLSDYRTTRFEFRFVNDFSNRYLSSNEDWTNGSTSSPINASIGNAVQGEPNADGTPNTAAGIHANHLAGSRNVEWYTNSQIILNPTSVIDANSTGFVRPGTNDPELGLQIGAFKITNENGVSYHFALPAYAFDEYEYSENINQPDGKTFNEFKKPEKYAYTWFLTAITGPDFVDRSANGVADGKLSEDDWGYWVEFEYGKWTDQYAWRNPETGYNVDIDNNFKNYSSGKKEIYYLDAVRTATHTAIFIKDSRYDAKSTGWANNLQTKGDYGFEPTLYDQAYRITGYPIEFSNTTYPVSSLCLKKILLFKNDVLKDDLAHSNLNYDSELENYKAKSHLLDWGVVVHKKYLDTNSQFTSTTQLHHGENVYDYGDFDYKENGQNDNTQLEGLVSESIRSIDFNYDYSLCPETDNSLNPDDVYVLNPVSNLTHYGKLTLSSVSFNGKKGTTGVIPPIQFFYDLKDPSTGYSYLTNVDSQGNLHFNQPSSGLANGDLLKLTSGSKSYYALVTSVSGNDHSLKIVGKNIPTVNQYVSWSETKNPPFNRDSYDEWGLYKPDYIPSASGAPRPRHVTALSGSSVDAWSLRKITSSLGSEIRIVYEPDDYSASVLQENKGKLKITNIAGQTVIDPESVPSGRVTPPPPSGSSLFQASIYIDAEGADLHTYYSAGQLLECVIGATYIDSGIQYPIIINQCDIAQVASDHLTVTFTADATTELETGVVYYYFDTKRGGGIRVNSICVFNPIRNELQKTNYNYTWQGKTSGVTSYEPDVFDRIPTNGIDNVLKLVKKNVSANQASILRSSREVPMPGVMYEYVTVSESIVNEDQGEKNSNNSSLYHFQVFKPNMLGFVQAFYTPLGGGTFNNINYSHINKKKIVLKDFTSWIGKLREVTLLDANGNQVSKTLNTYLYDQIGNLDIKSFDDVSQGYESALVNFSQQGEIQEATWDARFVKNSLTGQKDLFAIISKRQVYPAIQIGQTNINYKTGSITTTTNLSFDFYSGQATSTLSTDGYGNTYVNERVPAYRKYSSMGLAINGGTNMLTQEAANYTYKVTSDYQSHQVETNKLGLVSASAQTWANNVDVLGAGAAGGSGTQASIWRMKSSYSFIGDDNLSLSSDGLYPYSSSIAFNDWTETIGQNGWQKNAEITLYDTYSHGLEAMDLNQKYAATVMSQDHTRVSATVANGHYSEVGFSGAEEKPKAGQYSGFNELGNNIYCDANNAPVWASAISHSGRYSLGALTGNRAFVFSTGSQNNSYHVSVWCSRPDGKIKYNMDGGTSYVATVDNKGSAGNLSVYQGFSGTWYLLEADITGVSGYDDVQIWCEATGATTYFDDFRVHPVSATMTSYVYNEWGELSHILNANNLYTRFEYDGMGRLINTYQETFQNGVGVNGVVKSGKIQYNYAKQ